MAQADKYEEQPEVYPPEVRPAERGKAAEHDENMKEEASGVLELKGVDLVELKNKIPDEMG